MATRSFEKFVNKILNSKKSYEELKLQLLLPIKKALTENS